MVDTTGAGDSCWGGFLKCLLDSGKRPEDIGLEEAAEFAMYGNAVASLCVEKRGAIPAMPSVEEIEERLKL
jgi:fructokinase